MAGNPQVQFGPLNRLRGSVVIPNFPGLNVTNAFLGRNGISVAFEGETTTSLPQMVSTVQSPMPYQMVTVTINLIKTSPLASQWEAQRQTLSLIGDVTVTTDTSVLPNYTFNNCAVDNVRELTFNGEDASFVVTIKGYYPINASLWSLV